jgi:hypothetical protein
MSSPGWPEWRDFFVVRLKYGWRLEKRLQRIAEEGKRGNKYECIRGES